jgi:hypothetical protein
MARLFTVRTVVFCAALGSAALGGCGSLDGNPAGKVPLATLTGELVNAASLPTARNVRVAVVWRGEKANAFAVAVDLPVQPVFPAKFQIQLTDAPPASQMYNPFAKRSGGTTAPKPAPAPLPGNPGPTPVPGPNPAPIPLPSPPATDGGNTPSPQPVPMPSGGGTGSPQPVPMPSGGGGPCAQIPNGPPCNPEPEFPIDFRAALGTVVAYEDTNGNGKLDLVDDNAIGFIDRILGVNPNLAVVYLQGTLPARLVDSRGVKPVLGYNLFQIGKSCVKSSPTTSGPAKEPNPNGPGSTCTPTEDAWLPITTLYELPLSSDPALGTLMCKSGATGPSGGEGSAPGVPKPPNARPPVYPVAGTKGLRCFPRGTGYSLEKCTVIDRGLCRGTETTCLYELWQRPAPVPADWPCSAN